MRRILWLSQHQPLPRQITELKRLFGDVEVRRDVNPFNNAEEIMWRYKAGGYDDAMVVAPLSVIQKLCELGLTPLWGEMKEVPLGEAEVNVKGRYYRFVRFRRVLGVEVKFDPAFDANYSKPN